MKSAWAFPLIPAYHRRKEMAHDIAEELRRVQEELRVVKAGLAALSRVVEESVLFQALMALETTGGHRERLAAALRALRKVADMGIEK
jgi:hypothetical protein